MLDTARFSRGERLISIMRWARLVVFASAICLTGCGLHANLMTQPSPDGRWGVHLYTDGKTDLGMKVTHPPSSQSVDMRSASFIQDNPKPILIVWDADSKEFVVFYRCSEVSALAHSGFSVTDSGGSIKVRSLEADPKWLKETLRKLKASPDWKTRYTAVEIWKSAYLREQ